MTLRLDPAGPPIAAFAGNGAAQSPVTHPLPSPLGAGLTRTATISTSIAADGGLLDRLNGIPKVDIPENLEAAISAGRRMTSMLREVVSLRRGAGKLTPNEYFYYRLWEPTLTAAEKRRFVGKQAQHLMHLACNDPGWYAAAADKLLFQTLMAGTRLPVPPLLAVTQAGRRGGEARALGSPPEIARFLRDLQIYPLFAKPIAGKYSLSVVSADRYDASTDEVLLLGGERKTVEGLAADLASGTGYVIQRRLDGNARLARLFGPRLWSVRALVLAGPSGPVIHRAVAKIATGNNPADNFWRRGNMLGAIELETGLINRVVRGTGAEMSLDEAHPDTKRPIVGTLIPQWEALTRLVVSAAEILPGIRTQSWDVALAAEGPVLLEVNYGGDLNLAQLAHGAGVLDERYSEHLGRCGYRSRALQGAKGEHKSRPVISTFPSSVN